jgi:hypothetical protein
VSRLVIACLVFSRCAAVLESSDLSTLFAVVSKAGAGAVPRLIVDKRAYSLKHDGSDRGQGSWWRGCGRGDGAALEWAIGGRIDFWFFGVDVFNLGELTMTTPSVRDREDEDKERR